MSIDWKALEEEELHREAKTETVTEGGIVIPLYASSGHLRCWIKIKGEPAQVLYETPTIAMARWLAFKNNPKQEVCVFHSHAFGQAMFFFRDALDQIAYFADTFPTSEQGRSTPGSIWRGECECWRFGGPCPKKEK